MSVASITWGTAWRAIVRRRGISTRAGMWFYRPIGRWPEEDVAHDFDNPGLITPSAGGSPGHDPGNSQPQRGHRPCHRAPVRGQPPLVTAVLCLSVEFAARPPGTAHVLPQVAWPLAVGRR